MELEDFVARTLKDIVGAIEECKKGGMPYAEVATNMENRGNVEFDIAVAVDEKILDAGAMEGGIKVLGVNFGTKSGDAIETNTAHVSRIKFGIRGVFRSVK